ncbi:MAG: zinc-ribbon domain-containing protein [Bacilli bacterium]|nr:zinc-ribbon domain-containing protein [Bacilli bacterium]
MEDKTLVCVECGKEFTFTEGEQAFYAEKGFQEPKRCKECRQKAKERRNAKRAEAKPAEEKPAEIEEAADEPKAE